MKTKYYALAFFAVYLLFTTYGTTIAFIYIVQSGYVLDSIECFYDWLNQCKQNPNLISELRDYTESYYPSGTRLSSGSIHDIITEQVRNDVLHQIDTMSSEIKEERPKISEEEKLKIKIDFLNFQLEELQKENYRLKNALETSHKQ